MFNTNLLKRILVEFVTVIAGDGIVLLPGYLYPNWEFCTAVPGPSDKRALITSQSVNNSNIN
jgi:hypothetical protein